MPQDDTTAEHPGDQPANKPTGAGSGDRSSHPVPGFDQSVPVVPSTPPPPGSRPLVSPPPAPPASPPPPPAPVSPRSLPPAPVAPPHQNQFTNPYGQHFAAYPAPARPPQPLSQADERLWAMLAFLLAIVGGFVAPLVIYLVFKERSEFVKRTSRESLNLQISLIIVNLTLICGMLFGALILGTFSPNAGIIMFVLGWILMLSIGVLGIVADIVGAMKASSGETYRIPGIVRFVK